MAVLMGARVAHRLLELIESGDMTAFEFEARVRKAAAQIDKLEAQSAREVKALLRTLDKRIRGEIITRGDRGPLAKTDIFRSVDRAVDVFAAERQAVARQFAQKAIDAAGDFRSRIAALSGQRAAPSSIPATLAQDLADLQRGSNEAFAENLKARLRNDIARGIGQGKTAKQIASDMVAERVVTPARKFGDEAATGALAQAETRAADEVRSFFNAASGAQARADRVRGKLKIWIDSNDTRVRPAHAEAGARYALGGKPGPIPMTQNFIVGGEPLMFPHDPKGSFANTKGCRCISVEVLPDLRELLVTNAAELAESLGDLTT